MTTTHRYLAAAAAAIGAVLGAPANAEPVQIQHAGGEGAGYTFRRGSTCTVLTADHVVRHNDLPAADLTVLDRSGAKAEGTVVYANPAYDLALVALPDDPEVACTTAWPSAADLSGLNSSTRFEAVRHYPDGREALIMLTYAGGTPEELSLAPADRTGVRESDSGSIVMLNNAPAGIVLRVRTLDDRVDVLRFDTIDQLVGERFRGVAGANALTFAGVFQNNRENAAWSSYVRSWLVEQAGWSTVAAGDPAAFCTLQVNVMSWNRANQTNEGYARAQENTKKICDRNGFLAEQLCKVATRELESTPRTLTVHSLMLEVLMQQPAGATASKLGSNSFSHDAGTRGPEVELAVLQQAVAGVAGEMFESGACR